MKHDAHVLIISLAILTALSMALTVFGAQLADTRFYQKEFERLGVYDDLGKDLPDNTTSALLAYYQGGEAPDLEVFEPSERSHLEDVNERVRFSLAAKRILTALWLLLTAFVAFRMRDSFVLVVGKVYALGGAIMLGMVALLGVCALIFSAFFDTFHALLFPAGNYSFPADSLLLRIYPEALFRDFLLGVAWRLTLFGFLSLIIGRLLMRMKEKGKRSAKR